jgi:hypothetical protein
MVAACTPEPILPEALVGAALQGESLHSVARSLPFLAGLTHPILHMSLVRIQRSLRRFQVVYTSLVVVLLVNNNSYRSTKEENHKDAKLKEVLFVTVSIRQ